MGNSDEQPDSSSSSGLDPSSSSTTGGAATPPLTTVNAATPVGVVLDGEWAALNRQLAAAGLPQAELGPSGAHDVSVRKVLKAVLAQYGRRGDRIKELVGRTGGAAGLPSPSPAPARPGDSMNSSGREGSLAEAGDPGSVEARLRRSVTSLERQLEEAESEAVALRRRLADEARRAAAAVKDLKLQVRTSEHRVRAKEHAAEKLAEKLRVQVTARARVGGTAFASWNDCASALVRARACPPRASHRPK